RSGLYILIKLRQKFAERLAMDKLFAFPYTFGMITPKNVNATVRTMVPISIEESVNDFSWLTRKNMKITAQPEIMLYFQAFNVVNNRRGLVCRSAMFCSSLIELLRSRSRSSACNEKNA